MANPPQLSDEQRKAALEKAKRLKRERAEVKERLKMGSLTLAEALEAGKDDDVIGGIRMLAILESLPGVGKVKARRLMEECEIDESRRVRGLGPVQRQSLLEKLG